MRKSSEGVLRSANRRSGAVPLIDVGSRLASNRVVGKAAKDYLDSALILDFTFAPLIVLDYLIYLYSLFCLRGEHISRIF